MICGLAILLSEVLIEVAGPIAVPDAAGLESVLPCWRRPSEEPVQLDAWC